MKLYGIKACDTCRKALKALPDAAFVDVRATPLERAELARFLDAFGSDLVNTRSTTWRGMSEAERAADPLDQLLAHPTLMKRPVIDNGTLYLGWGKDVQAALT
ncbi:arsenate reductase family protein [Litoreibacter albidus]|uniref:Arsenate reductase, glutaredoxin family n=1 Tax=Litoreibacter albidus TaxID=670155 RepID=A0A1H2S5Q6_9RHOB|nr:ArsC/Spx/MgsR family protein [Litoreibacter albidus]SDW26830.1 Arsenate reductase, glutaredoxin family [Litoreibacter albidus]